MIFREIERISDTSKNFNTGAEMNRSGCVILPSSVYFVQKTLFI